MEQPVQLPLPMWRVQYQLLGGRRRMMAIVLVTTTLLIVGIIAIRRLMLRDPFPAVATRVLTLLTVIQVLVTVLGGANAVYRALLRDYQTKMNESHRLTPMSGIAVSVGYLFGSTMQITALFAVFTVVGAGVSLFARLPVGPWLLSNLILFNGAITIWAATVFSGMRLEKPFSPAPIIVGIAALTLPLCFVPGAALLLNIYSVLFAVWIMTGRMMVTSPAILLVAVVNVVFTIFWISAAARKYRRPDMPALNVCRGLILLVLALVTGMTGLSAFQRAGWTGPTSFSGPELAQGQWIATMIGSLILACVAIGGAVKCRVLVSNGAAPRDWSDRVPSLVAALVAAALICLLTAGLGVRVWRELVTPPAWGTEARAAFACAWLFTVAACFLALLTIRNVFELAYLRFKSGNMIVGLFVIVVWGLAPLADVIRAEYFRVGRDPAAYSWLLGCSPFGTISITWYGLDVVVWPGVLVQVTLLVLLACLARWSRRKLSFKRLTGGNPSPKRRRGINGRVP